MSPPDETPILDLLASMTMDSIEVSSLDPSELMLVRIAALVAVDAPQVGANLHDPLLTRIYFRSKEKMPPVNVGLLDGHLGWRQHDGGHTDGPNWKYFIPWADRMLKRTSAATPTSTSSPPPRRARPTSRQPASR